MLRGPDERLRLIASLMVALLLPILMQLVRLQILEHPQYRAEVEQLVRREYALPDPPWGCVRDRGNELLVGNALRYEIGAEVNQITDTVAVADMLAPILGKSIGDLRMQLSEVRDEESSSLVIWRPLEKEATPRVAERVLALNLQGVTVTPHWQRYYAEGFLAAHLLGFVNQEGQGTGVLSYHQRFLRPHLTSKDGVVTAYEQPVPSELANEPVTPYAGIGLRLTIDRTVQSYIEGELDNAILEHNAEGGTILVMNPRTGAILAMASRPAYDPAQYPMYAEAGEEDLFQNPAISHAYEPGSVFKIVTAGAALDSGRVDLEWTYEDKGTYEYGGIRIRNWSGGTYGVQDLQGVLRHSLNNGVAVIATQELGPELFYDYVRAFGLGQLTGVDLSGEASGAVHLPTDWDWQDSYLATNAYGQGIAVTPLQMASAVAAVANDGVMMQPYVVAERQYPDGRRVEIPPRPMGRPIRAETAETLSTLLENVIEREVPEAKVPNYRIAGKTGTAQIPGVGGYDPEHVIASFVGYGPLPDPQLLVFVKLDRPDVAPTLRWGSKTAAPLFGRIAERLFVLLDIPPSARMAQQ
jgi:cell division protein FtsI/penicillin-binding protein 2